MVGYQSFQPAIYKVTPTVNVMDLAVLLAQSICPHGLPDSILFLCDRLISTILSWYISELLPNNKGKQTQIIFLLLLIIIGYTGIIHTKFMLPISHVTPIYAFLPQNDRDRLASNLQLLIATTGAGRTKLIYTVVWLHEYMQSL
jgi:hypothetical protein